MEEEGGGVRGKVAGKVERKGWEKDLIETEEESPSNLIIIKHQHI